MTLKNTYPKISQWVSFGGTIHIQTVGHMAGELNVEVAVGDAGGIPEGCQFTAASVDEAMAQAEEMVGRLLVQSRQLLDELIGGELKDTGDEYLWVPGWPPIKNPNLLS